MSSGDHAHNALAHEILAPLAEPRTVKKAVILAAGRGRRMGKLTHDKPKAALEVDGHALIDWQIAALKLARVEEIAIVTGHGAAALSGRDVTYIHNPHWMSGTQVDSLMCARDWIGDDPVIVSYGDIIYHASATLALLERPGDIIIAYEADHRWLWKKRFGNWLKDSETFRLGPGQVLTEIGGKPRDIEEIEGQFMGLILLTAHGLETFSRRLNRLDAVTRSKTDFTRLLALLLEEGARIDTAANVLPWMEIDSPRDLDIANRMTFADDIRLRPAALSFPSTETSSEAPDQWRVSHGAIENEPFPEEEATLPPDVITAKKIWGCHVAAAIAVANWGRSGSTLLQSLLDGHMQILSTPNFYSRAYFDVWARKLCILPDDKKIDAFMKAFRQWWDTGYVDATAGLHQLGGSRNQIASVPRAPFEHALRSAFSDGRVITRKGLFEAAHIAYALSLNRKLDSANLRILFPIHGEPRAIACALLECYPRTFFVHTVREPIDNLQSMMKHWRENSWRMREHELCTALRILVLQETGSRDATYTLFGSRPYLGYLADASQVCAVRFEDIKKPTSALMFALARRLAIEWCDLLLESTWDEKKAWNRPESRNPRKEVSRPGPVPYVILRHLTENETQRLHYAVSTTSKIAAVASLFLPWPEHSRSANRRLDALNIAERVAATIRRADLLTQVVRREHLRASREQMDFGAVFVRRSTPPQQRHLPVRAILILTESAGGLRTQILKAPVNVSNFHMRDNIEVRFADEVWSDHATFAVSAQAQALLAFASGYTCLLRIGSLRATLLRCLIRREAADLPILTAEAVIAATTPTQSALT